MPTQQTAPFGEWLSPISAARVAAGSRPLARPRVYNGDLYWVEGRTAEGGRMVVARARPGQPPCTCTPAPFNVRTRVHEYGGGAYLPLPGGMLFSNFSDNLLYVQAGPLPPVALNQNEKHRYADFVLDHKRRRVIGVREDHSGPGPHPVNTICTIMLDGSNVDAPLIAGADFYTAPRLSPDGRQLAWLSWNHPRMPWEAAELWIADLRENGMAGNPRRIAGGGTESVCQPEWSPDGILYFVSDRSGWWNIYRLAGGRIEAIHPRHAEFGSPHWVMGESMYGFLSASEIACTYIENGISRLGRIDLASGAMRPIPSPYTDIQEIHAGPDTLLVIGGSPTMSLEVARIDLSGGAPEVLAQSFDARPLQGYLSIPDNISFPSASERTVQAFFYPPANRDYAAPPGERPPLVVLSHGGPTSMTTSTLRLSIQYWTSRGFAVLDVNYGGSSGFGRAYQDALKGMWGVVDVEDCVNGARHVVDRGLVDPERLIIRGGSAGGFTTLCALANHDVFKAGASHFGVSDLDAIDKDSHKFELRYNRYLIGPRPECDHIYIERSPVHYPERLNCPMIFFQGLEDKVVPPEQSQVMVNALRARGVPVAYVEFKDEGHGFRKSENIRRTLDAELYFYSKVFGFTLAEPVEPVAIANLAP